MGHAQERTHRDTIWSLIWHDPSIPKTPPSATPTLWHSDLDWIVARNGFREDDLLVAMRSGGPSNHEHADRNSIIVKAFGEVLVSDPRGAPYNAADPDWEMRTTAGHSAVLIDGKGHQYHDGSEGTKPSDASARIIRKVQTDKMMHWSSDATPAYQLVHPDLVSIVRTVIVLPELAGLILIDRIVKNEEDSGAELRFFVDDRPELLMQAFDTPARFTHVGHQGGFHAQTAGNVQTHLRFGQMGTQDQDQKPHRYTSISTSKSRHIFLVTAIHCFPGLEESGSISPPEVLQRNALTYEATFQPAEGKAIRCRIQDSGLLPTLDLIAL